MNFIHRSIDSCRISGLTVLTQDQSLLCVNAFRSPDKNQDKPLGGRTGILSFQLAPMGEVVLKRYRRGGLLGRFLKQNYLNVGKNRAQAEFEFLIKASLSGVSVPKPVAFLMEGVIFYKAGLVLEEIPQHQTLMEICRKTQTAPLSHLEKVRIEVEKLVHARIHHIDMHPGNILVDAQDRIYIIDFDKAYEWKGDKNRLRSLMAGRWNRAISKYGLPDWLLWQNLPEDKGNPSASQA